MSLSSLSEQLAGRVVSEVTQGAPDSLAVRFKDGAVLVIECSGAGDRLEPRFHVAGLPRKRARSKTDPTARQLEYLAFIKKYMARYGLSPAEADIQRYFMVSAPSVNNMIRTLERRGFITRGRDWSGHTVPRSIRVVWDG